MLTDFRVKNSEGALILSFKNVEYIPLYTETFFYSVQFSEYLKDKVHALAG